MSRDVEVRLATFRADPFKDGVRLALGHTLEAAWNAHARHFAELEDFADLLRHFGVDPDELERSR